MDLSIVFARWRASVPPSNPSSYRAIRGCSHNDVSIGSAVFAGLTVVTDKSRHAMLALRSISHWKLISKFYFEIKISKFSLESKHFHTGNKLSKANIDDASFDVCKHWPTDQSERSISEISQNRT